MVKKKTKFNNKLQFKIEISVFLVLVLLISLSIFNIFSPNPIRKTKVLGIATTNTSGVFWYQFLKENPSYIPGWIEIGRLDKASDIDPNYN